jgi:hypothetical protein
MLDPSVQQVLVSLRIRANEFVQGDDNWKVPGLSYSWLLAEGPEQEIGPGKWLLLAQPNENWSKLETVLDKPENVVGIKVSILGIGWTGQAEFDDVAVEPLD